MKVFYKVNGMSSSTNRYDDLEHIIFERGLRIVDVRTYQKINLLLIVLSDGRSLPIALTSYERLATASQEVLDHVELIGGGVAIHWPDVDEDVSLKGLLKGILRGDIQSTSSYAMAA